MLQFRSLNVDAKTSALRSLRRLVRGSGACGTKPETNIILPVARTFRVSCGADKAGFQVIPAAGGLIYCSRTARKKRWVTPADGSIKLEIALTARLVQSGIQPESCRVFRYSIT